jgi:thymidine kinase
MFSFRSSLDIIIGPMYSGKSTELIRRLSILNSLGFRVLYVNCDLDKRSDKDFSTHSSFITSLPDGMDSIKVPRGDFSWITSYADNYDVFGIDEAQLFGDLFNTVMNLVEGCNKKLIVSGLNGDFSRKEFGEILQLIPLCDDITKLHPYCVTCKDRGELRPALFSKRRVESNEQVLIGGNEEYLPVCRECY